MKITLPLSTEAEACPNNNKNSVRTSKRTPQFTTTKINLLMLFKEIIAVYTEDRVKIIKTECSFTDC
jgi:hypothetical protein